MSGSDEWNRRIIEQLRVGHGTVTGPMSGVPLLLLHHRGRRTGVERVNPVIYQEVDGGFAVFASNSGAPADPDWYRNLLAHPQTTIEVGGRTIAVTAHRLHGSERDAVWLRQKQLQPSYAQYEARTTRTIPVVLLERTPGQ